MENKDLPAMPNSNHETYPTPCAIGYGVGLTKREMLAMHAMQAMLSNRYVNDFNGSDADINNELCAKAVGYADALLEELEK